MTFRILLTSVGGAMSPYTIGRFLASTRHGIEIVGVDSSPNALGRHFATAFETVPAGDSPAYVAAILDIVRKRRIDLVLPCSDEEVAALSPRHADVEGAGAKLAAPHPAAMAIMTNKLETFRFLRSVGVPTPEWKLATSGTELAEAISDLRRTYRDVVVKPVRSRGSRDVYVIERNRKGVHTPPGHRECYLDLDSFMDQRFITATPDAPLLVMEGLVAPAHDTDVLCSEGSMIQAIPRRRINPAGVPFRGGVIVNDAELMSFAEKIVKGLGVSWLFDVDSMSDENGNHKVIEINSRPSGSLSAAAAAGMTILDDLVSLAKGDRVSSQPVPNEVTVLPYTSIFVPGHGSARAS